jgi:hypothetical protein
MADINGVEDVLSDLQSYLNDQPVIYCELQGNLDSGEKEKIAKDVKTRRKTGRHSFLVFNVFNISVFLRQVL